MRFVQQLDRFSGCLIRQCLEDALGFPVEGSPPGIYASYVEQFRNTGWAMLERECELYDKIKGDARFRKEVEKKRGCVSSFLTSNEFSSKIRVIGPNAPKLEKSRLEKMPASAQQSPGCHGRGVAQPG